LRGSRAAVSSTHWLASAAGMAMLDRGGNAFDAATAAAFVLQVVEPHQNGPGGDVNIQVYDARERRPTVVCGQGPMPAAATLAEFRRLDVTVVPGSGLLPACVPGAFGAWMRVLEEFGRLPVAEVLAPAIRYASDGFPLLPAIAQEIAAMAPVFRREWTGSGRTYLAGGEPPGAWARFRNPVLAATFRRLASAARGGREAGIRAATDAFYRGFVAEEIATFCRSTEVLDGTGERHRGLLDGDDLARWRATVERPLKLRYRDCTVHKAGPWSQGPVFLQQLSLLSGFPLTDLALNSAAYIHTVVECAKLALADREAWYGDPDHVETPMAALLSPEYTAGRRSLVSATASDRLLPGSPHGLPPTMHTVAEDPPASVPDWCAPLASGSPGTPVPTPRTGDTCCVAAADSDGNLIVATPSGGWLTGSPVIPSLGFPLGTRGQMAWLTPGLPNTLAPGKRPRTTLSPTLVLRDGEPYLAFGTPGGDQQDQWTVNFFLACVEFGLDPQASVEIAAFHTDHAPSSFVPHRSVPRSLTVEAGVGAATVAGLRDRGHLVSVVPDHTLGRICAVGLEAETGMVTGAASQRGQQAYAVVA
jgi:gamma-glutamyltranspeptidase/glutathione hydrolase